jgi:CelD/BcsL family acetyltransferase involved in cellulose biosynthesis
MPQPRLEILDTALTDGTLAEVEREWLALEATSAPSPYLTFAWLLSWIEVYKPGGLRVLRVVDHDDGVVGLGLMQELPLRRIRFAGGPVTPIRGMLCRPGRETRVWGDLANWIASGRSRYSWLGAAGIEVPEDAIGGVLPTPLRWFSLDLPGTFDEYFASLGSSTRRKRRREFRVAERNGLVATVLPRESAALGLEAFVRLHQARAASKGEVHPAMDQRLVAMLGRVLSRGKPDLQVNVVEREGATLAAAICLYDDDTCWGYNTGFDPAAARFSPGLLVHLQEIRAAIEHGSQRYDLGGGEHPYKRYLGGKPIPRLMLEFTSPSPAGRVMRSAALFRRRAAQHPGLRTVAVAACRTVPFRARS